MPKNRRYWDSDIFFTWLKKEKNKYDKCRGIMKEFEKGELEIFTSALTIAEVLYLKGREKIDKEKSKKIVEFFKNESIVIVNLDRYIAGMARDFVWNYKVAPKDAIHVASAVKSKIPVLDTFDGELIKLSNEIGEDPPLKITIPDIPFQEDFLDEKEDNKTSIEKNIIH